MNEQSGKANRLPERPGREQLEQEQLGQEQFGQEQLGQEQLGHEQPDGIRPDPTNYDYVWGSDQDQYANREASGEEMPEKNEQDR